MNKNLLLINLGSPDSPETKDVARYLRQFLTDPYVINVPAVFRYPLVYGIIVPFRAHKSAEAYRTIWRPQGSPLVQLTKQFTEAVAREILPGWNVHWAMRYGKPSIESVLEDMPDGPLYVVPLYPQYALSSTETALEEVRNYLQKSKRFPGAKFLIDFFNEPEFLSAQAEKIQEEISAFAPDHVLLSFHGLPENHLTKLHAGTAPIPDVCESVRDDNRLCYRAQCVATVQHLKARLKFDNQKIDFSFQSRLGRLPWIKPYTDVVIEELAERGARRILVSCPSFVADCLETLEEIQIRLREQFLEAGGQDLKLCPAVNATPAWVSGFCNMVTRTSLNWRDL